MPDAPTDVEVLRAWASRPEVQAMPEGERLRAAARELGLRPVPCPRHAGPGCTTCGGAGRVFRLGRRGKG